MSRPARVGLVGVGRWGRNVLRDLGSLGCEVWAVARSKESVRRAREGGAAEVVGTVDALPPLEGAVVCTPISTHHDVIEAVLAKQDVPVFVEKALTADPLQADRLADRHEGRLFVMDKWRYHPAVKELAAIAGSAELGPVDALHCRRVTLGHRYSDVDTVWVHAPHDLAIALEVLGELPPVRYASEERMGGQRVSLIARLGERPGVTLEVSCVAPAHRREVRLVCEDGIAYLDGGWSEEVRVVRNIAGSPKPEVRQVLGELPLLAELRAFIEHLAGGPPPRSSAREAAQIVRRLAELVQLATRHEVVA